MGTTAKEVVVAATFKVLVLGDSSVGKTSVISRYATGGMPVRMMATIGTVLHLLNDVQYCLKTYKSLLRNGL